MGPQGNYTTFGKGMCPVYRGEVGWKGNPYVTEYQVWHIHDIPLIGYFQWNGSWYVFEKEDRDSCETDTDWLYYSVTKSELDTMPERFSTPAEFDAWYQELVRDRPHWRVETKGDRITTWKEEL